jgi:hypothetical protein
MLKDLDPEKKCAPTKFDIKKIRSNNYAAKFLNPGISHINSEWNAASTPWI